jgi:hypothetical protein
MAIPIQLYFRLCAGAHDAFRLGEFRFLHKNLAGSPFCLLRARKIIAKPKLIQNARSTTATMAENHAQPAGPPATDYAEHEKTYRLFLQFIKYTMAGAAFTLALPACFRG